MKKLTLIATTLVMSAFAAVTYSSCTQDKCKDVVCQNGGTCVDGKCQCTTEYGGPNCETQLIIPPDSTSVIYQNKTYTPITITINGSTLTIPVGGSVTYTGPRGTTAAGTASTSGKDAAGNPVGIVYNWTSLNNSFPDISTLTIPLSINGGFFFLKVVNKTTQPVKKIKANFGAADESLDIVNIPNDSQPHGVGYYHYHSDTKVRIETENNYWIEDDLGLPLIGTSNQSATVEIP